MSNRERAMNKAQELMHCLCDLTIKCPCSYFKDFDVCKCSGEGTAGDTKIWFNYNHPELKK